jgi:hypothetical protein
MSGARGTPHLAGSHVCADIIIIIIIIIIDK